MSEMHVILIQHPVGQGGLFTAEIGLNARPLRWIYDCGSNQSDPLRREIATLSKWDEIDFLFLSHCHSDHVNGVDRLLTNTSVREVALPYMDSVEWALAIASSLIDDRLTGLFLDFAADPAGWLIQLGESRVTFVLGRRDDDTPGDPLEPPPEILPAEAGDLEGAWLQRPRLIRRIGTASVQQVDTATCVAATANGRNINWILSPFAHRPSKARVRRFANRLRREFGCRPSPEALSQSARTPAGRAKLRSCYDEVWNDHNLVTMTLYSGPVQATESHLDYSYPVYRHDDIFLRREQIGWLSLGDANLSGTKRRSSLLRHYDRICGLVNVLVVPHHGSASSFHRDFLAGFPNLDVAIVCSGPNDYGHPHKGVVEALERAYHYCLVGESASTVFRIRARQH